MSVCDSTLKQWRKDVATLKWLRWKAYWMLTHREVRGWWSSDKHLLGYNWRPPKSTADILKAMESLYVSDVLKRVWDQESVIWHFLRGPQHIGHPIWGAAIGTKPARVTMEGTSDKGTT